jgi:DNA-binding SARP family transcriptional activator/ActR/RegA family two-component response regulator
MGGATVLVVDDDPGLRAMVAQFLEVEGYRVLLATSGREALAHIAGTRPRPDLLLLDLLMPDIDGYAVLEHLRQHPQQDLPVLVFSAHHPAASLLQALDAERRDFIAKPFDLDELHIRLQRLLHPPHPTAAGTPSPRLRVYALGSLRVYRGDTLLFDESWRNRPAKSVFKILLTTPNRRSTGEALAEVLWPEVDAKVAINRLRVAVHDLRRQLGDLKSQGVRPQLLVQQDGAYVFDAAGRCWTDVPAFEEAVGRGRDLAARGRLEEALAAYQQAETLYQGDYLQDDPFADWSVVVRRRLRAALLHMLGEMARIYAPRGDVDEAVRSWRKILNLEPWREEVYRQLMGMLAEAGRPGEALRAFEECRRALAAEDVAPSPTTQQLRDRIRAGLDARRAHAGQEQGAGDDRA